MKKKIFVLLFPGFFVCSAVRLNAQFTGAGGTPGSGGANGGFPTTGGGPVPTVPFDGGLSLMLLASGVLYVSKGRCFNAHQKDSCS